jgi:lysyl-tRNA synthetase class II
VRGGDWRLRSLAHSQLCRLTVDAPVPASVPQFYEDKAEYDSVRAVLRRGDIVGVEGSPAKSKKGELSIIPLKVVVLSPCLHMLPKVRLDDSCCSWCCSV